MNVRQLNDQERKEWVEFAKSEAKAMKNLSPAALRAEFEKGTCAAEKAEIRQLVIEMLLQKKTRGGQEMINPLPFRKSAEAMRLAFPRHDVRTMRW